MKIAARTLLVFALTRYLSCAALFAETNPASSPVVLTIDNRVSGTPIPADFSGLSFETSNLLPDANGEHLFSADNHSLITLFRMLGIKSLRIGGGTADLPRFAVPDRSDIDHLFAFARAAGVKVIYTFRLLNGSKTNAAALAKYIMRNFPSQLSCFAIGNEPDWPSYHRADPRITDYSSYLKDWMAFAAAITNAAPGAMFEGPCTGGNRDPNTAWTRDFANDLKNAGIIAFITQHGYPGGNARDVTNAAQARDQMLWSSWLDGYLDLYNAFAVTALSNGLPYRLEEVSNFSGGVKGASDTFAAALWALDFLHWWAAHGASGINFHNRRWIPNVVIYPVPGSRRSYALHPIGYGIKAFDIGGHGSVVPVSIFNPKGANLTAYAVRSQEGLFVTIINKEHGPKAKTSAVTIVPYGMTGEGAAMLMTAPKGDVAAKTGITLGGSSLTDKVQWRGKWLPLNAKQDGRFGINVAKASAAIVRISPE